MNFKKTNKFDNDYKINDLKSENFGDFIMLMTERFKKYYTPGNFEKLTVDLFTNFIKENSNFIDVGAHYGYYTLIASRKIKSGKIYSLEPVAENFQVLRKNIEINKIKNVETYQLAASHETGEKIFNINEASDSSGFYDHPLAKTIEKRTIKTIKLDDLFGNEKVDIIKIDTEGHEMQVLDGMKLIIERNKNIKIFIEFNPGCLINAKTDPILFLRKVLSFGFEIYFIDDKNEKMYQIGQDICNWKSFIEKCTHTNILCIKKEDVILVKELVNHYLNNEVVLRNKKRDIIKYISGIWKGISKDRIVKTAKEKCKKLFMGYDSIAILSGNNNKEIKKINTNNCFCGNLQGTVFLAKTAIIIPTFNHEQFTIRCLDSIKNNSGNYIIIWVDNGSSEKSKEKVRNYLNQNLIPHVAILNSKNLGFVLATNQGIRMALKLKTKYIVLQNNDTEVYMGWLDSMIAVANSDSKIGLVGPITSPCDSWQSINNLKIKFSEFSDLPNYNENPKEYSAAIGKIYKGEKIESPLQLAFFCVLIKSDVIRNIGFLSEDFRLGFGDDDDFSIRALKKKWKIYLAKDVFIFHNHRTTFKSIYSKKEICSMQRINSCIFKKKHHDYLIKRKEIKKSFCSHFVENYFEKDDLIIDYKTKNKKNYKNIVSLLKSNKDNKRILLSVRYHYAKDIIGIIFEIAKSENYDSFIINDETREIYKIDPRYDLWMKRLYNFKYLNLVLMKKEHSMFLGFVSHSFKKGGSERSLIDMIDGLVKRKIMCHVYVPAIGDLEQKIKKRPVSYTILSYPWWIKSISTNIPEEKTKRAIEEAAKKLLNHVAVINPDVIYTNSSVVNVGAIVARCLGKPHIWHIREFGSKKHGLEFYQGFETAAKFIYENSDRVFFNSFAVKEHYESIIPSDKSEVLYNYIDENKLIVPSSRDVSYFKNNENLKMIILGGVVRGKGQKDAILAVKNLVEKGIKKIELLIIGGVEPVYHRELTDIIEKNCLENYVKFSGYINEPVQALFESDLMLMCSQDEAFGRVTAEALLMKKPVIGARSGGTPELVHDGSNGLLYEPENHEELAEKIKYFFDHREKLEEFGLNGYDFAVDKFNEEQYSGKVFEIVKELKSKKKKDGKIQLDSIIFDNVFYSNKKNKRNKVFILFWKKTVRIKDLSKKAMAILLEKGPVIFFSYAWKFVRYGRNYFR